MASVIREKQIRCRLSRFHLSKAKAGLSELKAKNELGKNYEHRLALIEKDLSRLHED